MAVHLHSQEIDGSDGGQGKNTRIDERRSDPPDEEIIGDQEIRLFYDPPESWYDVRERLDHQSHHNKIQRDQSQKTKFFCTYIYPVSAHTFSFFFVFPVYFTIKTPPL